MARVAKGQGPALTFQFSCSSPRRPILPSIPHYPTRVQFRRIILPPFAPDSLPREFVIVALKRARRREKKKEKRERRRKRDIDMTAVEIN